MEMTSREIKVEMDQSIMFMAKEMHLYHVNLHSPVIGRKEVKSPLMTVSKVRVTI